MKALTLLIVLSLFGCAAQQSTNMGHVWKTARSQTVRVEDGVGSFGSGVVLNDKCVLTAGHVADGKSVLLTLATGENIVADRVAYNETVDVAVVCATDSLKTPAVQIGPLPAIDDPVFTIGFPMGISLFLTQGQWEGHDFISAPAAPGNSGGGVFDAQGNYVGLVDAVAVLQDVPLLQILPHLCVVVDAEAIVKFLDANHISYTGHI